MHATTTSSSDTTSRAALLGSAFVLAALVALRVAERPAAQALASDVATVGELTSLTSRATLDEDVLCVLDTRSEQLLLYRVENRNRMELQQTVKLADAFAEAKSGNAGGRLRR